jgi:hypothetical protein
MKHKTLILVTSFSLLAAACGGLGTPPPGPGQSWIDAPLPNSNLPEAPYLLQYHAASNFGVTEFEVRVNGALLGSMAPQPLVGEGGPQGTLFYGQYEWTPPGPGEYLIGVQAKSGNGGVSPQVEVHVTVGGLVPLVSLPTATLAEGPSSCIYIALVNLFCREGEGTGFLERDTFNEGDMADVVGQSPDGLYAVVVGPHNNVQCYVPVGEPWGELQGSCDDLSVFLPPPTYTHTPLPVENLPTSTGTVTPAPTITPIPPPK